MQEARVVRAVLAGTLVRNLRRGAGMSAIKSRVRRFNRPRRVVLDAPSRDLQGAVPAGRQVERTMGAAEGGRDGGRRGRRRR